MRAVCELVVDGRVSDSEVRYQASDTLRFRVDPRTGEATRVLDRQLRARSAMPSAFHAEMDRQPIYGPSC